MFWKKLGGRRFALTLLSVALCAVGRELNIPEDILGWIPRILGVYIAGKTLDNVVHAIVDRKKTE